MAARTYLLASLSTELSNKVTEKLDDSDSFPVVWLQFLKSIQSTSIERFEDLKAIIKARLPNLSLAGGSGNEDFRFPEICQAELGASSLDIGFKDKEAANLHMQVNKLTYKDICAHAEDAYRTLFDRKEWPPARHTRDSKAPPAAFGNMATPITRAEVLNLIQSKASNNGAGLAKKGVCHKCNKPDTGRANAQRTTRARAGMGMAMKDQRMSNPGSLLLLHLEHPKSSKPMERLSTGAQAASVGLLPTQRQRTLASRRALRALKVLVLQSTMSPLPSIPRCGPRKLRSSQV
ncbi:hypothetical protein MHU86_14164 [Fragilaria crotonensis]|nr:hypothetical protein MHU86_14164 [Fragilaria crotonensis]